MTMHEAVPDDTDRGSGSTDRGSGSGSSEDETTAAVRPFPDLNAIGVALDAGKVGVWSWDIKSNAVKWSGNMEQIHALAPASFDGTFSAFQKDIHPEDLPEVRAAVQESV